MLLPKPLRGIVPPLVTPLLDPCTLDTQGLARLVEHVIAGGVQGLFVLGTTGEGPSLSFRLQSQVIERVCGQAAGRLPILVGITDTSFEESLRLARVGKQAGAHAVVYAGPCYSRVTQDELLSHIGRLAAGSPLPVFLYNIPCYSGVTFEVDTVSKAAQFPNVAGLKDSSGDLQYFQQVCARLAGRTDFAVLIGPEELLGAGVMAGGHGGVTGGANVFPELYVRLYEAAMARDVDETDRLQNLVLRVGESIYRAGTGASSYLRGVKCALSLAGICGDCMAEPYVAFGLAERKKIADGLKKLGTAQLHGTTSRAATFPA